MTVAAIPLFGTTWHTDRARYWQLRVGLALILLLTSAGYLFLYALILWDDHMRNGYSPAFWITGGVITLITVASVIDAVVARRRALTRIHRIGNPFLRNADGILRMLMVLVLRFLTPGLYLAVLVETLRPQPGNEQVAQADLTAQLAARSHRE